MRLIGIAACVLAALIAAVILLLPEPEGFPILEYHQVTDKPLDPAFEVYNVPPAAFAEQLDYLQAEDYTTITLNNFMYAVRGYRKLPEKPIVLTFDELKDMQRRGIEIGLHTADHLALTSLDEAARRRQVRESKILLEWSGLEAIGSLSYPNGAYNPEVEQLLREENYLTAVTGEAGLNTLETNPYELYRIHIRRPRFGLTEFKLRLFKATFFAKLRNIF